MNVGQLMQTQVVTVGPDASLKEVAGVLVEHGISGVPVCDDEGVVLGVVSEADILRKERGRPERRGGPLAWLVDGTPPSETRKAWATTARQAMTAPAVVVLPGTSTAEAARLMIEQQVNRLVVVDREGRLAGIVTRADLVRAFARSDKELADEIRDDVLRRVLWVEPGSVAVAVHDGAVELDGEVATSTDAEVLAKLVERVPGVVSVSSRVTFRSDDARLARMG